ncbi:translation initiation factor IF-2 [Candidatus Parcubacteria bacterium]|jgi:translation initiation factor IF-2|nr:MAG: translation initiation factor IF-2 [Candidatus Parcubacteria bacterium]
MNVTELARRLRIPVQDLRQALPRLGFGIGSKAHKVSDVVAQGIIKKFKETPELFEPKKEEDEIAKAETAGPVGEIEIPSRLSVREFAARLNKPAPLVISHLMKNGVLVTLNEEIDFETAAIVGSDFGAEVKLQKEKTTAERESDLATKVSDIISEDKNRTTPRPPVVVVMGHVDHGKTSLLDAIRKTNIAEKEHGGITQHIGAYQLVVPTKEKQSTQPRAGEEGNSRKTRDYRAGRAITFIDTPGHEAFTAMRSRGANIADVCILVIAADDGIKPQTREALNIIERTKIPFVVAINKIDKPGASGEKVKAELAAINLQPEDWGGKVITVEVSAKTGQGLDQLLEAILLVADMEKDLLLANPQGKLVGTVIESHIDPGEGPVATLLIQNGTLKVGDFVVAGPVIGKVRSLKSWDGKAVKTAEPAMPVVILGLKAAPAVGDILEAPTDEKAARKLMKQQEATLRLMQMKARETAKTASVIAGKTEVAAKKLPLFLKADKVGSLEAILESLKTFTYKEIRPEVVGQALGDINEADILRAEQAGAWLLGFNVTASSKAIANAKTKVKTYSVIYDLLDDIKSGLEEKLGANIVESAIGQARILKIFRTEGKTTILGAKVSEGVAKAKTKVRIFRNDKVLGQANLDQLQKNKQNVGEVGLNDECGLKLLGINGLQIGDTLVFVEEKLVPRKLGN